MKELFQVVSKMGKASKRVAAGAVLGVSSVAAFAQSSGSATPLFSDGAIMSSINGVVPIIVDVGGAVLAAVTVTWGFKTVRAFLGR
jgi:hypothetical protein